MSRNESKARSYAERHGIDKYYSDAQSLVSDSSVNAVYIATPPSSHATFAIMSMKAGKPCYIEKPMAASYDECLRINRISQHTGIPCFVAYYRRYLPYFQKVKDIVQSGKIGKILNVQIRYTEPVRAADVEAIKNGKPLAWRLQPDVAGGGYFYDMAPHQLDLLQDMFGVILEARGICANRGGLYEAEDSVSACFRFENGLPGSGSWCYVAHESAREDCIEIIGTEGLVSFSVFDYNPIRLQTSEGDERITVPNPPYVQYPIIKNVIEHLQGLSVCTCTSVSATPVNWVMDRILGKF
jgi:predicted dehydrogenase